MELPVDDQKDEKQKTVKTRRVWTQLEEEALIKCLKEIIPQGWKADNGFNVGYLRELEKEMTKIFPGTDIRPYPHIHSKLHVWKKNYSSIVSALSKSGIGSNNTTKTIDVEQEEAWINVAVFLNFWINVAVFSFFWINVAVFSFIMINAAVFLILWINVALFSWVMINVDTNARTMRNKPWPYYDDWCEIFGKDRAISEQAEDIVDTVNNLYNSNAPTSETGSPINGVSYEPGDDAENNYLLENTDSRLGEIAQRIRYEHDASISRKELFQIIDTIEGLTMKQKLKVFKFLVLSNEHLKLFLWLIEHARSEYLLMLLTDLQ
ncbi:hypothetical protein ACS0TY_006361 [Phlomoides rotata]